MTTNNNARQERITPEILRAAGWPEHTDYHSVINNGGLSYFETHLVRVTFDGDKVVVQVVSDNDPYELATFNNVQTMYDLRALVDLKTDEVWP